MIPYLVLFEMNDGTHAYCAFNYNGAFTPTKAMRNATEFSERRFAVEMAETLMKTWSEKLKSYSIVI